MIGFRLFNPFNIVTILTISEITIQVKHPNLSPVRYRKIWVKELKQAVG
jgi:hypothetical protein